MTLEPVPVISPPAGFIEAITGGRKDGFLKPAGKHRYTLKPDVPRRFLAMVIPEEVETLDEDFAKHFFVNAAAIVSGLASSVQVQQRTLEVFTG